MANFDSAIAKVLVAEGGYQAWKADKGNYNKKGELVGTKYGISAEAYEDYYKKTATKTAMQNLTKEAAKEIYKKKYWNRMKGDDISSQNVADVFLDGVVNHGKGVHLIQQVLKVTPDGAVGPITLKAINESDPNKLVTAYLDRRKGYYHELVKADASQKEFLKGWLKRLEDVKKGLTDFAEDVANSPEKKKNVALIAVSVVLVLWGISKALED